MVSILSILGEWGFSDYRRRLSSGHPGIIFFREGKVLRMIFRMGWLVLLVCLFPCRLLSADFPEVIFKTVAPGVTYGIVSLKKPLAISHIVRIDLTNKNLSVEPLIAQAGETLGKLARRLITEGHPLLVALNGDYFSYRDRFPWGIFIHQGELFFSPTRKSALLLDFQGVPLITQAEMQMILSLPDDGPPVKILAVNRWREQGEKGCFLYTSHWGAAAPEVSGGLAIVIRGGTFLVGKSTAGDVVQIISAGSAPIPEDGFVLIFSDPFESALKELKPGAAVSLRLDVYPPAREAIGGGPLLVRSGRVSIETSLEDFNIGKKVYLERGRHPRSAIGYNSERDQLILVAVEGRIKKSEGMNIYELAEFMLGIGCWDAMSFDGGRSVGLFIAGREVVEGERIIGNALAVFARAGAKK